MIVDDHDMVRSGLAVFIDTFDDLVLVGEASDGAEAVRPLRRGPTARDPHGPVDAQDGWRRRHARHPPGLTRISRSLPSPAFSDRDLVQGALQAGALGYLLKTASIDELAEAIRNARRGRPSLAPEALQILGQRHQPATSART